MKERRSYVRVPFVADVKVTLADQPDVSFEALSRNIGGDGMRLHLQRDIQPQTRLIMTFNLPIDKLPLTVKGRVAWSQRLDPEVVDAGIEFTDINSADQARIISYIVRFVTG